MSKTTNDIEEIERSNKYNALPLEHRDVILKYLTEQQLPFKKRLTHIKNEIGYPITSQKVTKVLNLATTKRKHIKGDVYYEMEELLKYHKKLLPREDYKIHKRTKALYIKTEAITEWMSPHHPFFTHRLVLNNFNATKKQLTLEKGVTNTYYVFNHLPFNIDQLSSSG